MESIPALRNIDLSNQVAVQVAKKSMDVQKHQGEAVVELIRDAAKAGTSQSRLDVYA